MPPSGNMRTSRPSAREERMSSLRELASNPSFSRLTSSGQIRQLDRYKQASESAILPAPKVIADRYHVVVPFHEGKSMSSVYLTTDGPNGGLVVVKMASDFSDLPLSTMAIRRERHALDRIKHGNVVGLKGHGSWEGKDFLVLEYVRGSDLYLLTGDYGRLPWDTTRRIMLQMCDALDAAHSQNIVHDDIKPENIIISSMNLKATLLDFGLARFLGADPASELRMIPGIVVGTFPYMAPETFDAPHYDHRADIYSLGVVMYEMLAGRNPFDGENIPEVVDRILNYDPEPPSSRIRIPDCADRIVMRSLAKDPLDRFRTAAELKQAIASCDPG